MQSAPQPDCRWIDRLALGDQLLARFELADDLFR